MHEMVFAVRDEMQVAYPELKESAERVSKVVLAEEEQFARVLDAGLSKLEMDCESDARLQKIRLEASYCIVVEELEDDLRSGAAIAESTPMQTFDHCGDQPISIDSAERSIELHGDDAFRLYETFGLPLDFMVDAARDAGIAFDMEGFERAKEEEQARARACWKGGSQKSAAPVYRELPKTEFEGYSALRVDGARVLALVKDGVGVPELKAGETGEVVLDATSFYADSGGQVGDVGWLYSGDHNSVVAEVSGATKPVQGVFAHKVRANQTIAVGDTVDTVVDADDAAATMRNHTGTHLLHAALRRGAGEACEAGGVAE